MSICQHVKEGIDRSTLYQYLSVIPKYSAMSEPIPIRHTHTHPKWLQMLDRGNQKSKLFLSYRPPFPQVLGSWFNCKLIRPQFILCIAFRSTLCVLLIFQLYSTHFINAHFYVPIAPRPQVILGSMVATMGMAAMISVLFMSRGEKLHTVNSEWRAATKEYMKFQKMNPITGESLNIFLLSSIPI